MMGKKIMVIFTFFISTLWFFASIPISTGLAEEPKYGGTIRIGARIPQYNRLDARYPTTESMVPATNMIHDLLFDWEKGSFDGLVPRLATGYETKDAKEWIIHLRKGVKFHNGKEMTAEDVKANFDWRIDTPKGWRPIVGVSDLKYLKMVEVIDKYTIKIILEQPFAPFIRHLSFGFRGVLDPEEVEKSGDKVMLEQSGTGPFKIVEVKPNEKVVLERFEDYWGPKPYVDRVELIFMRSSEARLVALQKGEIDICQLYDEATPTLKGDSNLQYEEVINTPINHKYYFNMRRWPMNDIRFRKAAWMGADWKNIAINSFPFQSGNYTGVHLGRTKYFDPEAMKLVPSYDPEEAKTLIRAVEKDAGKKIPPIYWLDSNAGPNKTAGEMAKLQLEQVGIPVNLQLLPHGTWFDKLVRDPKMEWDMGAIGYGYAESPSRGFNAFFTDSKLAPDGKSLGAYSNPEFDQWIIKAEESAMDEDQIKYYREAEKVLLKDAASIPLFFWRMVIAWNKNVKGVVNHPNASIYVYTTWANVWLDK